MGNQKKFTLRTRLKGGIVAEFLPPVKKSFKVIILCGGMPSYPEAKELMFKLSNLGYWSFLFRYRGSWESDGLMFARSPHLDVRDVIDSLSAGFCDLWSGEDYIISNPEIYLLGSSFGGTAAILASSDPRVKKAFALSPVIDWRQESELEPNDFLEHFTRQAFGQGYRFALGGWEKIKGGRFFNPIVYARKLKGKKIYIVNSRDDLIVLPGPAEKFTKISGCHLHTFRTGGHLGFSGIKRKRLLPEILHFFAVR